MYMYIYATHTHRILAIDEIMPFVATWMDLEIIVLSEVRKRHTIRYHLYVESKI